MADSRLEALKVGVEKCGLTPTESDLLYQGNGEDIYNRISDKSKVECFNNGGPQKGFLERAAELAGSLVEGFKTAASSDIPTNLAELKEGVDAGSTAGQLRDRGQKIESQLNGMSR